MPHVIEFGLEPQYFPDFFDGWGDDQFEIALKDGVKEGIDRCLHRSMGGNLLKYRISDHFGVGCSDGLVAQGISLRQIRDFCEFDIDSLKIQIDTPIGAYPSGISIKSGHNINFRHWLAGYDPQPIVTHKEMKKWDRYSIRLSGVQVESTAISIDDAIIDGCTCQPETLKPTYGPLLRFKCFICANLYMCECFHGIAENLVTRKNYSNEAFQELLLTTPYKRDICHLCRDIPSTTIFNHGGQTDAEKYYSIYAKSFRYRLGFDERDFYNSMRDRLGIPRVGEGWISEMNLVRLVRTIFPETDVLHQASPDWLGRQRFDVYVPEHKLAIEYNGEQHYFPVSRFGGQDGFEATLKRDNEKRVKSAEAGVVLIEFRYDESITLERVRRRIERALSKASLA
ncbi:MAG: hypothetical protein ACI9ZM_000587 [Paracoccaceae bacterium]